MRRIIWFLSFLLYLASYDIYISYLSQRSNKITELIWFRSPRSPWHPGMAAKGSRHISAARKQSALNADAQFSWYFLPSVQSRIPAHGVGSPIFRLGFPTLVKPVYIIPHRLAQRLVSRVITNPIRLKIKCHTHQLYIMTTDDKISSFMWPFQSIRPLTPLFMLTYVHACNGSFLDHNGILLVIFETIFIFSVSY